ncbi:WYL domain-containing protein [Mesobacillus subterraneus]|uniref:WYL domain-containing protein n=1 Tax=Mesobacillus subterraneus TaxID=285983 RepID=UPI002041C1DF|nr:WYL domain-containing protein [Mesobacillus subterraneus]MCM3663090.1 WYL domain-containing protein [Mesobacillus subterraneus]MCM3682734.1 WYL domain-containing protein [Mesobacillus subterraneus]
MNTLLTKSLKENTPVEMIYLAANNQITQRRIIVKELRGNYFKAFCYLRSEDRLFKIDNILSVMPEKRKLLKTS